MHVMHPAQPEVQEFKETQVFELGWWRRVPRDALGNQSTLSPLASQDSSSGSIFQYLSALNA